MNSSEVALDLPAGLRVAELGQEQAEALAAGLFHRSFASDLPGYPSHYALLGPQRRDALAYVHFLVRKDYALGGGMCVDALAFRALDAELRRRVRERGGLAQILLESAVSMLDGPSAAFGYVGDRRALTVDLRAGFQLTGKDRLIVRWLKPLPQARAQSLVDEVAALGPF